MRPTCDRHLDEELVAALVRDQFPDVDVSDVRKIDEGWDNEVYDIGGWIFRFPRHVGVLPWFERELGFMPAVADAIGVPVPRYEKVGHRTDAFPYPFVGYRRIPGVAADESPAQDLAGLAADLGRAFGRLHAMDARAITMPTPTGWERVSIAGWRRFTRTEAARLASVLPADIVRRAAGHLEGTEPPPPDGERHAVVHNDIAHDHVLVDPRTGRLSGIIDFSDLMVGDPMGDFVGLITIGDHAFIDAVLGSYSEPTDDTFRERITWATRRLSLVWLLDLLDEGGEPGGKHSLWVERAFA